MAVILTMIWLTATKFIILAGIGNYLNLNLTGGL